MSSGGAPAKRRYDATRRRERASAERRATRARVLAAATKLFVANGYRATTMADIALEAGVAMQSVYTAGQSKADLLHECVQLAVAGDDEPVMIYDRPFMAQIADEPDPVAQARLIAEAIFKVQQRSAPMQRAQIEAAAVEPVIREILESSHRQRLETLRVIAGMIPADRLRHSPQECVDLLWALGSPEIVNLLVNVRGWDWPHIREWYHQVVTDLVLPTE